MFVILRLVNILSQPPKNNKKGNSLIVILTVISTLIILFILQDIFLAPDDKKITRRIFQDNPIGKTLLQSSQNIDINNPPQFIQADFIGLDKIYSISKFRSGSGHDFSKGSGETCRSMKHYFNVQITQEGEQLRQQNNGLPPPPDGNTDIPIYSPVDGRIAEIGRERMLGNQIYIQPDSYPSIRIRLFHIYELEKIKKGVRVVAGEQIGVIGQHQNTDIAITQGRNYISYFEVMPDSIFDKYQDKGAKSREEFIISKEYRDANPLQCNGEWFAVNYDSDPTRGDFVHLSGYNPME